MNKGFGYGIIGVGAGPLFRKKLLGVTIITINTCVLGVQQQHAVLIVLVRGLVIYSCKLAYQRAEDHLMKSVRGEDASSELDSVATFYGDDLDRCRLELQLQSLAAQFREDPDRHDIVNYLKTHTAAERVLFSEVVRIVLVNPGFEVKLFQ